ncbi:MAG: hypothetical protein ABII12_18820 [Planctomycetota bacterium]
MTGKIKQLFVYARVTFVCAILALVVVVVYKNWGYHTHFWPGAETTEVSTLWLILATSAFSIAVFWTLSKMRRVFRDLAQLREERAERQKADEQHRRQERLDQQERRIDEKIQQALDDGSPEAEP